MIAIETPLMFSKDVITSTDGSGKAPMFIILDAGQNLVLGDEHLNKILYVAAEDDTATISIPAANPHFVGGTDFDIVNIAQNPIKLARLGEQHFRANVYEDWDVYADNPTVEPYTHGKLSRIDTEADIWLYNSYRNFGQPITDVVSSPSAASPLKLTVVAIEADGSSYEPIIDTTISGCSVINEKPFLTVFAGEGEITPSTICTLNLRFTDGKPTIWYEVSRDAYHIKYKLVPVGSAFDPWLYLQGGSAKVEFYE